MDVAKTPVSILTEMMLKQHAVPNFELVENGSGTHQNRFTYVVVCDGIRAEGSGRCKKDAKHEAARAMLEKIAERRSFPQLPASPNDSPVRTPLPMKLPTRPKSPLHVPFRNFVGELNDICITSNLQSPIYEEVSDVGPPHARVFTIRCIVATFKETGIATTKKQAKHDSARKMIDRIRDIVPNIESPTSGGSNASWDIAAQTASRLAIARYPELTVHAAFKTKENLGIKIKDYYKRFKERFSEDERPIFLERLDQLEKLLNDYQTGPSEKCLELLKKKFEELLVENNIEYHFSTLQSIRPQVFLNVVQVHVDPDIVEIGSGGSELQAEINSLKKAANSMKTLMRVSAH